VHVHRNATTRSRPGLSERAHALNQCLDDFFVLYFGTGISSEVAMVSSSGRISRRFGPTICTAKLARSGVCSPNNLAGPAFDNNCCCGDLQMQGAPLCSREA